MNIQREFLTSNFQFNPIPIATRKGLNFHRYERSNILWITEAEQRLNCFEALALAPSSILMGHKARTMTLQFRFGKRIYKMPFGKVFLNKL